MLTLEDFKHWEEIEETAHELKKDIEWHLHDVWNQYYERNSVFFKNQTFPSEVVDITNNGEYITISGSDGYGEFEFCRIPIDIVFGDEDSRTKALIVWKQRIKEAQENAARLKEEKERTEYARLQAKFGAE